MRRMLTERIGLFYEHRWRVMRLAGDAEWPLTDHPVLTLNYYGPSKYDFGAGWGREGWSLSCRCHLGSPSAPRLDARRPAPGPQRRHRLTELQRFVVERALRWIVARKPEPWISTLRPRVVDVEAFAIEQESWRAWNAMHLDSEAEFITPRTPSATS